MAEKARHILRLSIIFLFVLAIFFFLCIFLLGLAKKHMLKNEVDDKVPIQQNEYNTWGKIPGELNYSWTRSYKLYEFAYPPTSGASAISLNTVGSYEYDLARNFTNATWYPQKSVVSYNETYEYTATTAESESNADETMYTINMGAYDVWYQMVNKPKFFQAWQALAQAYELMLNSNYLYRLEAYNCYHYFFNDYAMVQSYVLRTLLPEDQDIVYNDEQFGMSTIEGLTKWVQAAGDNYKDPSQTDAYKAIVAYFATLNINLNDDQMKLACGNGSMLMQIQAQVQYRIQLSPSLHQNGGLVYEKTISSQWGFSGVTAGEDINLQGVDSFYSVADLNEQFPYPPEFSAFVLDPARGASTMDNTLNYTAANKDFSRDLTELNTFLNLDSMRQFYTAYETKDISTMYNHFLFKDWTQAELFYTYLDDMVNHFLLQNTTYDIIALSSLMDKNLNNTEKYLEETLPINVASRVAASLINTAGLTCTDFFTIAITDDPDRVSTICAMPAYSDFTDVNTVKGVANATWYGALYATEFQTATGLSGQENYNFFLATTQGSFGYELAQATAEIAVQYGCSDTANCTGAELGALQWGSLGVTQNPKSSWGTTYMPTGNTVAGWGNAAWLPFGVMTESVEYPQTTAAQEVDWKTISMSTALVLCDKDYDLYGLGAFYNWQKFLISYYTTDSQSESMTNYQNAWGSEFNIDLFVDSCRSNIELQMFGGAFAQIKVSDMLEGYVNDIADKVNGGNYILGNDFSLYNVTTPIQNDRIGFQSNVTYGTYTGSNGVDEIGQIRIINGQAFANKVSQIFDGTSYVNITQNAFGTKEEIELDDVSNGMQFPPGIENDDQLSVYDSRNLKIMRYTHDDSQEIGKNNLRLEKFSSASHGNDVSFGYNLPMFQKPYGCYSCVQNSTELRTVMVDGQEYNQTTVDSDFYTMVQPDTGYMYSTVKNSTVFMIIGGHQTFIPYQNKVSPFPSLDPIYGAPWPLYDFSENLTADEDTFTQKFDYVATTQQQVRSLVIATSVLAAFFLVLGIVAITIYKIKDPKRKVDMDGEEVLVRNQDLLD